MLFVLRVPGFSRGYPSEHVSGALDLSRCTQSSGLEQVHSEVIPLKTVTPPPLGNPQHLTVPILNTGLNAESPVQAPPDSGCC